MLPAASRCAYRAPVAAATPSKSGRAGSDGAVSLTVTTTTFFSIRLTRETMIDGRRHPAGTEIELEAVDAAGLVRSGRARLVDLADLGPLLDALDARRRPAA